MFVLDNNLYGWAGEMISIITKLAVYSGRALIWISTRFHLAVITVAPERVYVLVCVGRNIKTRSLFWDLAIFAQL